MKDKGKNTVPGPRKDRRARMVKPHEHDPYARRAKSGDARVCDSCGLVNHAGRWYRGAPPLTNVTGGLCPACERTRDRYPAGTIRLHHSLVDAYRDEFVNLVRNAEQAVCDEHPLERLMEVKDEGDQVVVTTTGVHLARRIAGRLKRRFGEAVRVRYPEEENLIQVDVGTD